MQNIVVEIKDHPFKDERSVNIPVGVDVKQVVDFLSSNEKVSRKVYFDGIELPEADWSYVQVEENTNLRIVIEPGVVGLVIASVILAVGSYLYTNRMLKKLDNKQPDRFFNITGTRNRLDPFGRVPVVLGKRRTTPPLAARPYSEWVDDKQYYRQLFCVGYGPLKIEDIRIGQTPIDEFEDVQYQVLDYFENFSPITLFPDFVIEENIGIEMEYMQDNPRITRATSATATQIGLDFLMPQGVRSMSSQGKVQTHAVGINILVTGPDSTEYVLVREGQDTPSHNLAAMAAAFGLNNFFTNVTSVVQNLITTHGISVSAEGDYLVPVNAFNAAFVAAGGISSTSADTFPSIYFVGSRRDGFHIGRQLDLPELGVWTVGAKRIVPSDRGDRWEEGRVINQLLYANFKYFETREEPDFSTDFSLPAVPHGGFVLIALRIRATAQLNGSVDELNCIATTVTPEWDDPDWRLETDLASATIPPGSLNIGAGGVSALFAWLRERQFLGQIGGWGDKNLITTQNPAHLMRWVLQGPMNPRPLSTPRLDLDVLEEFRDWCDEEEFTCNYVIDTETTLFEELQDIAFTGRAKFRFRDGLYSVVVDREQAAPSQVFSDRDVEDVVSQRAYFERVDGYRVEFENEEDDYQRQEIFVRADELASSPEDKFESVQLKGVTNYSQAYRLGRFGLGETRLRRELYTIDTDVTSIRCNIGDWVKLQTKVLLLGQTSGRVKGISGNNIIIDEPVIMEAGKDYALQVRGNDFSISTKTALTVVGKHTEITLNNTTGIEVGNLFTFGEAGLETLDCVVEGIRRGDELDAQLDLRNLAPALFTLDESAIPPFDAGLTRPPTDTNLPPPIIEAIQVVDARLREERGETLYTVNIFFRMPTTVDIQNVDVEARYIPQGGQDTFGGRVFASEPFVSINNLPLGRYTFRIRALDRQQFSSFAEIEFEITGEEGLIVPVPDITGLEVYGNKGNINEFTGRDCKIIWNPVSSTSTSQFGEEVVGASEGDLDNFFNGYIVRVESVNGLFLREVVTPDPTFTYTYEMNLEDGGPRREFVFKVYVRGSQGQMSRNPGTLQVINPPPVLPGDFTIDAFFSFIEMRFTRPFDPDFEGTKVYLDTSADVAITPANLVFDGPETKPITLLDLAPSTTYFIKLVLYDTFGDGPPSQEFIQSTGFVIGTDEEPPTQPGLPTLSSETRETKLFVTGQLNAEWDASTDNSGLLFYEVEYWVDSNDRQRDQTVEPNYTVFPAEVGATYSFRVRAIDYSGNESPWTGTATHQIVGDTTAPGIVEDATATAQLRSILLEWTNPSDSDLLTVRIYQSTSSPVTISAGNLLANFPVSPGAASQFLASDLAAGTQVFHALVAVDVSGNASDPVQVGGATPFKIGPINVSAFLDDLAIQLAQIANGAISETKIQNNAISTPKLQANSVIADKIAANAVTANKIQAGAVIADKIAANAVEADKIAANAITADKIAANAVVAGKIAANAVTAVNIDVTNLAAINADLGQVTAGTITGLLIRTAASGQRVELSTANGIRTINSGGTTTAQFNVNGSGSIGAGGTVMSWNTAGNLTIPGGLISGGIIQSPVFRTASSGWRVEIGPAGDLDGVSVMRYWNGTNTRFRMDQSGTIDIRDADLIIGNPSGGRIHINANPTPNFSSSGFTVFNASNQVTVRYGETGAGFLGGQSFESAFLRWSTSNVGRLMTSNTGTRVQIDGSDNSLKFFAGGTEIVDLTVSSVSVPTVGSATAYLLFRNGGGRAVDARLFGGAAGVHYAENLSGNTSAPLMEPLGAVTGIANSYQVLGSNRGVGVRGDGNLTGGLFRGLYDITLGGITFETNGHPSSGGHIQCFVQTGSTGRPNWPAQEGTLVVRREAAGASATRVWVKTANGNEWLGLQTF